MEREYITSSDLFFLILSLCHFAASTISAEDRPEPPYGEEMLNYFKDLC